MTGTIYSTEYPKIFNYRLDGWDLYLDEIKSKKYSQQKKYHQMIMIYLFYFMEY